MRAATFPLMASAVRALVVILVLPLVGFALMVSAMLIPDRLVMDELYEAVVGGTLEEDSYPIGYSGSRLDGFSECKRITIGLGAPAGTSLVETAVSTPSLGPCATAVPKITGWATGEGLTQAYSYFRYWNGSAAVFRPAISAVGLDGTRILAAIGIVAAAGAFWLQASRRVGRVAATLWLLPVVATTDFIDLPRALLHALGMIVALSAAALLLRFLRADDPWFRFALAAFVAGATFLFLGDMTNPDAAWALTAASAAVVAAGSPTTRQALVSTASATGGWILGFGWMWVSKWLIALPVIGVDAVRREVTGQIEFRVSGETPGGFSGSILGSARRAVDAWFDQPLTLLVIIVAVITAGVIARRASDLATTWPTRLLIAAPAVIPVAWHLVLRNHTHFHAWFTYRSFPVGAGIVLMAVTARLVRSPSPAPPEPDSGPDQAQYGSTASGSMS